MDSSSSMLFALYELSVALDDLYQLLSLHSASSVGDSVNEIISPVDTAFSMLDDLNLE